MTATIVERVQAGAEYLDRVQPGWVDVIDLDRLDLASGCDCVLGQLAIDKGLVKPLDEQDGAYWDFVFDLDLRASEAVACGFNIAYSDDDLHSGCRDLTALTAAWRDLIVARRAAKDAT